MNFLLGLGPRAGAGREPRVRGAGTGLHPPAGSGLGPRPRCERRRLSPAPRGVDGGVSLRPAARRRPGPEGPPRSRPPAEPRARPAPSPAPGPSPVTQQIEEGAGLSQAGRGPGLRGIETGAPPPRPVQPPDPRPARAPRGRPGAAAQGAAHGAGGGRFWGASSPSLPVVPETVYNRRQPWLQERNPSVRAERHGFQEAPPPRPSE